MITKNYIKILKEIWIHKVISIKKVKIFLKRRKKKKKGRKEELEGGRNIPKYTYSR